MTKIEIELTDDQLKKVEILKSKDVSVGQAIDLLFEVQHEALAQIEEQNDEDNIMEKMKNTNFDIEIKQRIMKENFEENETYDKTVLDAKHKLKWSEFFKF